MQLFTYWARQDFSAVAQDGRRVTRTALGWSSIDQAEAVRVARQRAERAVAREIDNQFEHYEYGHVPPREPVLDSIEMDGQTIGLVTRNRYGARVLNTDRVLFADIDLPWNEVPPKGILQRLLRLLSLPKYEMAADTETLERVRAWHRDHPHTALRIYRTHAGVRLLFTDRQYDPTDRETLALLESLGSDKLYVQLTKNQQAFRARLSPKPWRCGVPRPQNVGSHIDHPDWPEKLAAWAETYEPKARPFATCRYVDQLGILARDPIIERIIAIHDHATLNGDRPLA